MRLFAAFFSLAMLVILIVGTFSYIHARNALIEQLNRNLALSSSQLAESIDRYLSERANDTLAIALHYSLFNLKTTTSNQNEMLGKYLKIYPDYEKINIINVEDIRLPEGIEQGGEGPWYMHALSGVATSSDMYVSELTDKPTMSFAAPVYNSSGRIESVITTNLNLDQLWNMVDRVQEENSSKGLTGYAFVVNDEGYPIAYPDKSRLFSEKMLYGADASLVEAVEHMRAGQSGVVRYVYEGIDKHASFSPCRGFGNYEGHGWSVCVTYPHDELMEPFGQLLKGYLIVTLIATMLALLISTVISNYLVRPILSLMEGASRIGSGDFSFRIKPGTEDELGELASSFNYMAETLQERDRQINEYTRTLTEINNELKHRQEELGKTNEVLSRTNEELNKLQRQKAEFTAMITHDIKSPLSTILTYADMILSGAIPLTEIDVYKTMRNIFTSGHKILNLVENYLVSSAIEAGRLELNRTAVSLPSFIAEEAEQFKPQFDKKRIDFTARTDSVTPLVQADKVQLDRAFSNLLSNSIKFTQEGGAITVSTGIEGEHVYIAIEDNGKGIPEKDMDRIFGKFRRVEEAAGVEGIGLGLFISKTIIEAHGGRLAASSAVGKGSVFTIYLPIGE